MAKQHRIYTVHPKLRPDGTPITLTSEFPDIAKEWDYSKNNRNPEEFIPGSNYNANWICPKGHHYSTAIAKRTQRGDGCPFCSGKQALAGFNDLLTLMPELALEWHPEKNDLMPYEVRPGSKKKVWWICPKCGCEYQAIISNRTIHHSDCPKCRYKKASASRREHNRLLRESSKPKSPFA